MTHTEIIVVDSGYFDPNDGFTARPIIGSQGLPESGYDGGAPFYQVVPSGVKVMNHYFKGKQVRNRGRTNSSRTIGSECQWQETQGASRMPPSLKLL